MTFNDPLTYRKPWTIAVEVELVPDTELLENVCNENEKDRGHLVGHIEDEKQGEVTVSAAILSNYAGVYAAGPLGHIRVTMDLGHLAFDLPGGGGQLLAFAQSEEDFILPALGVALKFEKDADGAVTFLRITSVEGDIRAPRMPDGAGGID
jgi:hypothetical protein